MENVPFTPEMLMRTYLIVGFSCLLALLFFAYINRITVYRDYADLSYSILFVYTLNNCPGLAVYCGDDAGIDRLVHDTAIGRILFVVGAVAMVVCAVKTYTNSIADNGLFLGLVIAPAKLLVACIISALSVSLIKYLFRDERKLGHVAIFFILLGVFSATLNILINGDRTGTSMPTEEA